ncbi:MAG: glycoside hydrolase family 16 protein [Bacteroidota bacterium]|nr:glycoside hydrolase family 16 protein [Bacteroidota bacterium]
MKNLFMCTLLKDLSILFFLLFSITVFSQNSSISKAKITMISDGIARLTVDPYSPDTSASKQIPGMVLVFSDEFNYEGKPDPANWTFESGFIRNDELQWYQSDNANCSNGRLLIEGRRVNFPNPSYVSGSTNWKTSRQTINYTSSSIHSKGKHSWLFGRFEVRARIDTTKGSWPAIWTLGINDEWPACGEIDLMEFYRKNYVPSVLANVGWGSAIENVAIWDSYSKPLSQLLLQDREWSRKYHIWRMDWTKDSICLYMDDVLYNCTLLKQTLNVNDSNPFLQPHFMLLNLALGSNGGEPANSVFPINYEVDYVRIYQKR